MRNLSVKDRFYFYARKGASKDDCWKWSASKTEDGYGILTGKNRKQLRAHRYSYEIHKGMIPIGMCVLHSCNNPECANPRHLRLGTHKDNVDDRMRANRTSHKSINAGESNGNAKLNKNTVIDIRLEHYTYDRSVAYLARKYGIGESTTSYIVNNKTWMN
jgi:hypothetical protein